MDGNIKLILLLLDDDDSSSRRDVCKYVERGRNVTACDLKINSNETSARIQLVDLADRNSVVVEIAKNSPGCPHYILRVSNPVQPSTTYCGFSDICLVVGVSAWPMSWYRLQYCLLRPIARPEHVLDRHTYSSYACDQELEMHHLARPYSHHKFCAQKILDHVVRK